MIDAIVEGFRKVSQHCSSLTCSIITIIIVVIVVPCFIPEKESCATKSNL